MSTLPMLPWLGADTVCWLRLVLYPLLPQYLICSGIACNSACMQLLPTDPFDIETNEARIAS